MKLKPSQSIAGGVFALFLSFSCCWLPLVAIAVGRAGGCGGFFNRFRAI